MHISVFKFVSVAKPQQFEKHRWWASEAHPLQAHINLHYPWDRHQNKRQAKFCLLVLRCCFSGMSNFLHTLRLTRLKMSEIILTGCKTQIIIIIKTVIAQLKVHINTTAVAKYDNNKYDKPEKL